MPYEVMPGTPVETRVFTDLSKVEYGAQEQARAAASLPWTRGLAVMPDVHQGFGVPIGCVLVMEGALSPAAVGVDIACGVAAIETNLTMSDMPKNLGKVRSAIEAAIPVGFDKHQEIPRFEKILPNGKWDAFWKQFDSLHEGVQNLKTRAMQQCGTLGSGNHFVSLATSDSGNIWLMLHSGSRGIGKELAERHITAAKSLPHNLELPKESRELSVVLAGTPEMAAYRRDLMWAQEYAFKNRAVMMALFQDAFAKAVGKQVKYGTPIQAHHNYVSEENWDGLDVFVTRKGAISASAGTMGMIPGAMGGLSFIVEGLGNPKSFNSASHGAGRKMSRGEAKRRFTLKDLADQTKGVECRKDKGVIDESPGAYKDIEKVMAHQADLVKVHHRLKEFLNVKG